MKEENDNTKIKTCSEIKHECDMTIDEIEAQKKSEEQNAVSDEEVKVATDRINPDEGTLDRG